MVEQYKNTTKTNKFLDVRRNGIKKKMCQRKEENDEKVY